MISPPPGWRRHGGAHVLTLTPPRGRARIRYHARLRARAFVEVVADLLAEETTFRVEAAGPVSRLVTEEGEYGAFTTLRGVDAGGPARRWIGAVLLDEYVAALDGLCYQPELDDLMERTTRWLLANASFGMGMRRRRYRYRVPGGWFGVPSGLVTHWYPPDFPRRRTMLTVFPAERSQEETAIAFDQLLGDEESRGLVRGGTIERQWIEAPAGPCGFVFSYRGRWPCDESTTHHSVAVLSDGIYRYVLRLESASPGHDAEALAAVARTVRSLPRPGAVVPERRRLGEVASPWSD